MGSNDPPVLGGGEPGAEDEQREAIASHAGFLKRRCCCQHDWGQMEPAVVGTDGGRLHGLVDERTVYGALDAIDQALEQALTARTEREQRWQLNQLRGLLLTLPSHGPSLDRGLRRLIRLLRTPVVDR